MKRTSRQPQYCANIMKMALIFTGVPNLLHQYCDEYTILSDGCLSISQDLKSKNKFTQFMDIEDVKCIDFYLICICRLFSCKLLGNETF